MLFFDIILLLFVFITTVYAKKNCVALVDSTVCAAFSQFYVDIHGLGDTYTFLSNITTIQEFDQALINYTDSTSMYLFDLGCLSTNFNADVTYARYSITRLCAQMLQNTNSLQCNTENDLIPPPLCQSTCDEWVESVTTITNNPRVCASSSQRNTTINNYWSQCETWQGFNGTVNNNCISGIANEPYTCGFGSDLWQACQYCRQNSTDECCQSVQCGIHLSGGAIAGIVIGCIAFASIALICAFCIYRKKKRNLPPILFQKFMPSNSTSTNTLHVPDITEGGHVSQDHDTEKNQQDSITVPSLAVSPPFAMNQLATSNAVNPLTSSPFSDEFFVVIHPYPPQVEDELALSIGDIVCQAVLFDDGWALGFNVTTGLKGAFPMVCVSTAPKESLEHLLNMNECSSFASHEATLHNTMDRIKDNVNTTINLSSYNSNNISSINTITNPVHNTIPKRSGSTKSYDFSDCESPSSPTVNTPFIYSQHTQSNLH